MIKRYYPYDFEKMVEDEGGAWVEFADHAAEVARLEKERDELKARIKRMMISVRCAHGCEHHEGFPDWRLSEIKQIAEGKL